MVYSCAYFASPDEDLDAAGAQAGYLPQTRLRLSAPPRPGLRLGALVMHAARRLGGRRYPLPPGRGATERIRAAGTPTCRVVQDYREMHEPAAYDALVSVGMFERRAGPAAYFRRAWDSCGGGRSEPRHHPAGHRAAARPDLFRYLCLSRRETLPLSVAARRRGRVRGARRREPRILLTLRHWVRRWATTRGARPSSHTYRVWRLFMSSSAGLSRAPERLPDPLVKPDAAGASHLPLSRADWYA